ncbi:IPT/TIG domain-containing protein [Bacteroides faecichinchillae]|uniref:IPT/TIG domain-containing protein n=1 Tax=Bacteroides faecichinchillae TaxID=871325 RepID=A0A1M4T9Q8_9BACE|nr:IPT/TIG domain-containing protein [Bacteroides faecichinchillae]THG55508.1 hypothetical protein E5981_17520 [Bacteroides faecichinchillae]SHE41140.1 IPT/TIG domain-containing protein [Bacteroides faecichinchillae]
MNRHLIYALALCGMMVTGCSDTTDPTVWDTTPCDPSRPVEFTNFTPKEGGVRTRLFITGSNFGKDENKITVTIGGQKAPIISTNGSSMYCMLPPRAYSGIINIIVKDKDDNVVTDYTFEEPFNYQSRTVVGTLLRKHDPETGAHPFQDGSIDDGAGLPYSDWMIFDPKPDEGDKIIFTSNYDGGDAGLRAINLTKRTISTLYSGSRSAKMQSFEFSADGDTLLFADDNGKGTMGDVTMTNIWYALRSEGFTKLRSYCYGPCAYAVAYMPDGTIFYTVYPNGSVLKMDRGNNAAPPFIDRKCEVMCSMNQVSADKGRQIKIKAHPEGKYVLIFSIQTGAIYKCDFDPVQHRLGGIQLYAGDYGSSGNANNVQEGVGAQARFARPWAGCFAYNPRYANRPDGDMYDFVFMDQVAHCMWKITPDQVCSIIAGRSNYTVDNSYVGYIDGDPLHEARFNAPRGITYDPEEETYYLVDNGNHAIRYLRTE